MPIFSSNFRGLIYLTAILALLACGADHERPSAPFYGQLFEPNLQGNSQLRSYFIDDPSCQLDSEIPDIRLRSAALSSWGAGGLSIGHYDLETIQIHSKPLRGKFISQTNIGASFLRSCDLEASPPPVCRGKSRTPAGWLAIDRGKALKVCNGHLAPKRAHAEHLALSALLTIEMLAPKIKEILPQDTKLEPLLIQVAPLFASRWISHSENGQQSSYRHVLTDNISYIAKTEVTPPFIAILPQKIVQDSSGLVNLWESPFVVMHEYAHYIEDVLGLTKFNTTRSLVDTAFSEAFADILAYATIGHSDHISAIPCAGKDRAPDSLEFANGVAKIFTKELLLRASMVQQNLTIRGAEPLETKDVPCQGVTPHSAHGFGAIFAYWLAELASLTPNFHSARQKNLSNMAIEWRKILDSASGDKILEPNTVFSDADELAKEIEAAALALETVLSRQFERQRQPLPQNVRELLLQKMSLAFGEISKRQWFEEKAPR